MHTLSFIAQATPDISGVPAEFVKNFLIMLAWAAGAGLFGLGGWLMGRKASGKQGDPHHIQPPQPFEVTEATKYAEKAGTDEAIRSINERVESMARENLRAHNETAKQVNGIIQAGAKRESNIMHALAQMEQRITAAMINECKEIHLRINPLAEASKGHEARIHALQERCKELWEWISDYLPKRKSR